MLVEERVVVLDEEGEGWKGTKKGEKVRKAIERVERIEVNSQSIPISSACLALALRVPADEEACIDADEGYSNDSWTVPG